MIDTYQLSLDKIATVEDRAIDAIGPAMPEGSRILEADRRVVQAIGWIKLARQVTGPDDAVHLARAQTHLLRALDLIRETVT
jgi:hypothetical protein